MKESGYQQSSNVKTNRNKLDLTYGEKTMPREIY